MIIVKNRELLIPNNERYVGTTYDDNSTVRTFRISRFNEDGMDKSQLDFYVIINYDDGTDPDAVGVVKSVSDDYIVLEWDVGEDVTDHPGCLYLWVRGFDHTGTVRWSSFPGVFYIEESGTAPTDLSDLEKRIAQEDKFIRLAKLYRGHPMTAATAAEMVNREQIYVYVGNEVGYQYGHWYFWNGSAWTPGGVYNSAALQTDKELIASDVAADAKAVGDKIALLDDIFIWNLNDYIEAMASGYTMFRGAKNIITVNSPINVSDKTISNKTFTNLNFVLNADMFAAWQSYKGMPTFLNCIFKGNGNNLISDGSYPVHMHFINCIFDNCGIVENGEFVQSCRFEMCTFIGTKALIEAKGVYDCTFSDCAFENNWQAKIINIINSTATNRGTKQLRFVNCVIEGQNQNDLATINGGGDLFVENCYLEGITKKFAAFVKTDYFSASPFINLVVRNCKISWGGQALFDVTGFTDSDRYNVLIDNCEFSTGASNAAIISDLTNVVISRSVFASGVSRFNFRDTQMLTGNKTAVGNFVAQFDGAYATTITAYMPCIVWFNAYKSGAPVENQFFVLTPTGNIINLAGTTANITATKNDDGTYSIDLDGFRRFSEAQFMFIPLEGLMMQRYVQKVQML